MRVIAQVIPCHLRNIAQVYSLHDPVTLSLSLVTGALALALSLCHWLSLGHYLTLSLALSLVLPLSLYRCLTLVTGALVLSPSVTGYWRCVTSYPCHWLSLSLVTGAVYHTIRGVYIPSDVSHCSYRAHRVRRRA